MTIEQVWPDWKTEDELGNGSFGTVYKCSRETESGTEYCAVKVVDVPREGETLDSEIASMDKEKRKDYFKEITDDCITEIKILESLKNSKNIVNIFDSRVVEKENGIGWQIFIRMELLTDMNTYMSDKKFTADDVRKFALDMCSALTVCAEKRIIHRDIKPENIFVDAEGNFKLGDFGVAKQMDRTYASTMQGALNYVAPEVLQEKKYDSRADIYSLGLVLYKLLNNNRMPFLDPNSQFVRHSDRQKAYDRRMSGEKIPPIPGVDEKLMEIVLKACEFKPSNRFRNIAEMKEALESESKINKGVVKFVKKHKVASIISVVLVLAIVSGSIRYLYIRKTDDINQDDNPYPKEVFSVGTDVATVNGTGVVCDKAGIRVVNEKEGTAIILAEEDCTTESVAFNGKTAVGISYNDDEIYIIDVLNNKIQKLPFNSDWTAEIVFFNDNEMYYLCDGNENSDEKTLYMFNFSTQENQLIDSGMKNICYQNICGKDCFVINDSSFNNSSKIIEVNNIIKESYNQYAIQGRYICSNTNYCYFYGNGENSQTVYRKPLKEFESVYTTDNSEKICITVKDNDGIAFTSSNFVITEIKESESSEYMEIMKVFDLYSERTFEIIFDSMISVFPINDNYFGYSILGGLEYWTVGYADFKNNGSFTLPIEKYEKFFENNLSYFIISDVTEFGIYYEDENNVTQFISFNNGLLNQNENILKPYPRKNLSSGCSVTSLNGKGIIANYNGLYLIDEYTEKKDIINNYDHDGTDSILFDGNVIFELQDGTVYRTDVSTKENEIIIEDDSIDHLVCFDSGYLYFVRKSKNNNETYELMECYAFSFADTTQSKDDEVMVIDNISEYSFNQIGEKNIFVFREDGMDTDIALDLQTEEKFEISGSFICSDEDSIYYFGNKKNKESGLIQKSIEFPFLKIDMNRKYIYKQTLNDVDEFKFDDAEFVRSVIKTEEELIDTENASNIVVVDIMKKSGSSDEKYIAELLDLYSDNEYLIEVDESIDLWSINENKTFFDQNNSYGFICPNKIDLKTNKAKQYIVNDDFSMTETIAYVSKNGVYVETDTGYFYYSFN